MNSFLSRLPISTSHSYSSRILSVPSSAGYWVGPGLGAKDQNVCLHPEFMQVSTMSNTNFHDPREPQLPASSIDIAGSFQFWLPAFALGLGASETFCVTSKSGVPEAKPHWPSVLNAPGCLLSDARLLGWGAWCGAQSSHTYVGEFLLHNYFSLCVLPIMQ